MSFSPQNCTIDTLFPAYGLPIDVLRLDKIHPVVSGNKWYKLKEYLQQIRKEDKSTLLTFGGAYSNHIVATAAATQEKGLRSIGIIRGGEPKDWSLTLQEAKRYGMDLRFVSRKDYQQKLVPEEVYQHLDPARVLVVPEGGYGFPGKEGARTILTDFDTGAYTHITSAVGTGTTLAGLIESAVGHQKVIGLPVLKNAFSLTNEIDTLLPACKKGTYKLVWDYHFGGYAKYSKELILFMNEFYSKTGIPTDFVYTAKAFYATLDLFRKNFFTSQDKVLLVHTGGLQGNLSLPKGTLIFGG